MHIFISAFYHNSMIIFTNSLSSEIIANMAAIRTWLLSGYINNTRSAANKRNFLTSLSRNIIEISIFK